MACCYRGGASAHSRKADGQLTERPLSRHYWNGRFPPIADISAAASLPLMQNEQLDSFGRYIWLTICLALAVAALFRGGWLLFGLLAIAVIICAVLFAVLGTTAATLRGRGGSGTGTSLPQRFGSNFRRALLDGPLFILAYW